MARWIPKSGTLFVTVTAVILCVLFARSFHVLGPVESAVTSVVAPVYHVFYQAGSAFSSLISRPSDIASLTSENERLRSQVSDLQLQLAQLQGAQQENASLRQLLNFFDSDTSSLPHVTARVIGRDPENPLYLILNAGERDGIKENNAVVVEDGIMVAKITQVHAGTSIARLLTDSDSDVAATISNGLPTSKVVKGERGLSLILDQVPQGETLTQGQLVITSGLEPEVPRGLLVGEIEDILSQSSDLFQRAVLKPATDYSSLLYVAVILSPNS